MHCRRPLKKFDVNIYENYLISHDKMKDRKKEKKEEKESDGDTKW